MSIPQFEEIVEPNDQTKARREHLESLRELVGNVYPNKFERSRMSGDEDTITRLNNHHPIVRIVGEMDEWKKQHEGERPPAELKDVLNARLREFGNVRIAGRLAVPPRVMGKAAFVHLSDGMSRLQIYVRRDDVQAVVGGQLSVVNPDREQPTTDNRPLTAVTGWEIFQLLDHGDFIGVEGYLFITNTGELSVHVEKLQFLAKAMLPMPDKMHGIADPEIRQRQRYLDLIASSLLVGVSEPGVEGGESAVRSPQSALSTRQVFETRAKIISSMRRYLEDHGYIEVETPMLTPKATGAAAKPFKTFHEALKIDLYARIAPELYLKRLVVGGFEKVYELNRNFRNEGISYKHNPEFTMLEFYCAYMDVEGMMDFCEEMMKDAVQKATGRLSVNYEANEINFSKFERMSMRQAIDKLFASYKENAAGTPLSQNILANEVFSSDWIDDRVRSAFLQWLLIPFAPPWTRSPFYENKKSIADFESEQNEYLSTFDHSEVTKGQLTIRLFDSVEPRLIQPTFIVDYPKSISPLSKASPENPQIAERFELFINGMEVANGFSELNDPREQYERFVEQMSERERGDEEAMVLDEDYIRALSYGMPPAAGIGIGIDRLVMLLTNRHSIRDVILFPHMRPEKRDEEKGSEVEEEN